MQRTSKYCVTCILFGVFVIALSLTACVAENIVAPVETSAATPLMPEQPVLATTAVVAVSNTLTPTTAAAMTPSLSPLPPTPTSIFTPLPAPTIERLNWNLKIAFASLQESDGAFVSELWVLELPEQESRQLISFRSAATSAANRVSWSHDGQYVAFSHHVAGNEVAVSIVDVVDSTVQQLGSSFPLDPFNTGNSSAINLSHDSWSVDDQWVQVTLSYFKPDSNFPIEQELLLSTVDGQVIELDEQIEFVAWSQSIPDQFLYILHPDLEMGYPTVHIGQVGLDEPVVSIPDLGKYSPGIKFNIDWSPDSTRAVVISYDVGTRNSSVVLINLQQEAWELLYEQQSYDELPFWSSDGRWIAMWHKDGLYLWEINETNYPTAQISLQTEFVTLLGWLPDKNWLVYQADDVLYAVDPEMPDSPYKIFDLNSLGIISEQRMQMSVWIPSQP
jgi:Tol biopolymer transport system component